ncbi:MAG: PEP-CTERM sorting domain-containing protein [Verrucomicrobia bacterium]|nr:PEP-CTERM sorting domain-containing protein [Verrucomicrobiota bacterium]
MIKRISKRFLCSSALAFLVSISSLKAAVLTGREPLLLDLGNGPDVSFLVIDDSGLSSSPLKFAYHYSYDSNNPLTGLDLLRSITSDALSGLSVGVGTTYFGGRRTYLLDSFSFHGSTVQGTPFSADNDSGIYWSYYVAGVAEDGFTPLKAGIWSYAQTGLDARLIAPGSWDGWTISSYIDGGLTTLDSVPSVSLVPEPSTTFLVIVAGLFFVWAFRRKSSTKEQN